MNDLMHTDDFERQVADVAQRVVGPPRTVDALAIARQATTDPPKRRFPSMFSALKFVAASAIVALFGAFLLSGILPSGSPDEAAPARPDRRADHGAADRLGQHRGNGSSGLRDPHGRDAA